MFNWGFARWIKYFDLFWLAGEEKKIKFTSTSIRHRWNRVSSGSWQTKTCYNRTIKIEQVPKQQRNCLITSVSWNRYIVITYRCIVLEKRANFVLSQPKDWQSRPKHEAWIYSLVQSITHFKGEPSAFPYCVRHLRNYYIRWFCFCCWRYGWCWPSRMKLVFSLSWIKVC